MKIIFFSVALMITVNLLAQSKVIFTKKDATLLSGSWKGSLTYLDYNSGKPYTMPANTIISMITGTDNLLVEMIYPDEPKANNKDTLFIAAGRTMIDEAIIVEKKVLPNGSLLIVAERKGKDGNNYKNAIIRKTYTIGKTSFINRKDVQFEGTNVWIKRHEYSYTR